MERDEGNEERRKNGREERFPVHRPNELWQYMLNIQLDGNFDGLAHTKSFDGRPPYGPAQYSFQACA